MLEALELLSTKGLKRLPVVDLESGHVVKLISQSTLNSYLIKVRSTLFVVWLHTHLCPLIYQHPGSYSAFHEDTVGQIPSFHKPVISVSSNAPALRAFELMMKHDISAVGCVVFFVCSIHNCLSVSKDWVA